MAINIFYFLVFPGLLFTAVAGAFLSWFDRKITARVQFRKGPPVMQPFYDFFKLLLCQGNYIAKTRLACFVPACSDISCYWRYNGRNLHPFAIVEYNDRFRGDVLVIFYLLTIPSFSYIIGALASGNPLASVGASREMKLILSYELTFLLLIAGIIMKSGRQLDLYSIINTQQSGVPFHRKHPGCASVHCWSLLHSGKTGTYPV